MAQVDAPPKSIVERHCGRIWAAPAPGEGTVVTCLLPWTGAARADSTDRTHALD
ncbi:hypothetical protein [Dactylosporangium sp. NPDC049140]|uniref:hypothetical protein n=1 Tax=Dactylosporangium sp. NPDC049140 TaxID=3155647 RepID=UPI0033D944B7